MGAYDGYRRREPVAPAVGDRPSIGDRRAPRQSVLCAARTGMPARSIPGHLERP
jgi:hypothetical protein